MRYLYLLFLIIFALNAHPSLGQIKKEKTVRFWIANNYKVKEEKLDEKFIDVLENSYALEGFHYPRIIERKDSALLINNSIIYDSDNLAEYIVPDKEYEAKRFINKVDVNESKVRKYLGLGEYKEEDQDTQLNHYDRYIYCLYLRDYVLNLVRYDTLEKKFLKISLLDDRIDLKKSFNEILFFFSKEILLIANPYNDNSIVFDQIPYYVSIKHEPIGVGRGFIYYMMSPSEIWFVDYKTGIVSKLCDLTLDVSGGNSDISYFLDVSDMRLYISYFDLASLCLVSDVYKIPR